MKSNRPGKLIAIRLLYLSIVIMLCHTSMAQSNDKKVIKIGDESSTYAILIKDLVWNSEIYKSDITNVPTVELQDVLGEVNIELGLLTKGLLFRENLVSSENPIVVYSAVGTANNNNNMSFSVNDKYNIHFDEAPSGGIGSNRMDKIFFSIDSRFTNLKNMTKNIAGRQLLSTGVEMMSLRNRFGKPSGDAIYRVSDVQTGKLMPKGRAYKQVSQCINKNLLTLKQLASNGEAFSASISAALGGVGIGYTAFGTLIGGGGATLLYVFSSSDDEDEIEEVGTYDPNITNIPPQIVDNRDPYDVNVHMYLVIKGKASLKSVSIPGIGQVNFTHHNN